MEMLRLSGDQGVDVIAATPHFYAWKHRIEVFLEKREAAYESLMEEIDRQSEKEHLPRLMIGAEAAFFEGISRADQIEELTIRRPGETSDILLLEMPFHPWTHSDIEEVEHLLTRRKFTVILAHLERYRNIRENKKYLDVLVSMAYDLPLYIQLNAESFLDWKSRGKLLKMIKNGEAHLLGTDCHGVARREPNLKAGRDVIAKKLGAQYLTRIDELGNELIS